MSLQCRRGRARLRCGCRPGAAAFAQATSPGRRACDILLANAPGQEGRPAWNRYRWKLLPPTWPAVLLPAALGFGVVPQCRAWPPRAGPGSWYHRQLGPGPNGVYKSSPQSLDRLTPALLARRSGGRCHHRRPYPAESQMLRAAVRQGRLGLVLPLTLPRRRHRPRRLHGAAPPSSRGWFRNR
ncbi:MAG: hypothetical protein WKG07_26460 [Hymenobacter sp.]